MQVLHAIGRDVRIDSGDDGTTVRFRVPVPRFPAPRPPAHRPARDRPAGTGARPPIATVAGTDRPSCRVAGDLDLAGVTAVRPALLAALRPGELVLDLCDTGYVSSAGVALLMELTAAARHRETVLAVRVAPGSPLARVLDLTGLARCCRWWSRPSPRLRTVRRDAGQHVGAHLLRRRRRVDDLRPDPRCQREEPLPHRLQPLGAELALARERHLARQVQHEHEVRARGEVGEHPEVGTLEPPQRAGDRQQGVVGVAVEDTRWPRATYTAARATRDPHAERPDDDRERRRRGGCTRAGRPPATCPCRRPHRRREAAARPATSVDLPTPSGPEQGDGQPAVPPPRGAGTGRRPGGGPHGRNLPA